MLTHPPPAVQRCYVGQRIVIGKIFVSIKHCNLHSIAATAFNILFSTSKLIVVARIFNVKLQ